MYSYFVRTRGSSDAANGHILEEGENLITGTRDFRAQFGSATSLEQDLLTIASSVFAADRASKRGERENISRHITLDIPVTNVATLMPLIIDMEEALYLLSQDNWQIKLRNRPGKTEQPQQHKKSTGKTLLFSGGLDSLAAAVEFGHETNGLQLVSHKTRNPVTDAAQKSLVDLLTNSGFNITHQQFLVSSKDGGATNLKHAEENSQRTRSFVFLILGALVARRTNHHDIVYMAENGQMAIHLPLTSGRAGAFSTHTAHPAVIAKTSHFLTSAMCVPLNIVNPYVSRTKKEVIEPIVNHLAAAIPLSTSCWRNARITTTATHCGACVPCYIRRIAIESWQSDPTKYERDVWSEAVPTAEDDGHRNLVDLLEFVHQFSTQTDADLMANYPELYSPHLNARAAIEMYRRFAVEATSIFNNYPKVTALLA